MPEPDSESHESLSALIAFDLACQNADLNELANSVNSDVGSSAILQELNTSERCVFLLNFLFRSPSQQVEVGSANDFEVRRSYWSGNDRFEVLAVLGSGAMGTVYKVRDLHSGTDLALKQIRNVDANQILRFKQEFRSLVNIAHDNLIVLHELFGEREDWFFTMELVDGRDILNSIELSWETDEQIRESNRRLCKLLRQLCGGLNVLHRHGIIHRDVKPTNVLVTPDDRVVIIDMGLSLNLDLPAKSRREIAGTDAYIAPEQATSSELTFASDWYSVGVMLYQMLSGKVPFVGPVHLIEKQVIDAKPLTDIVPQIPEVWSDLCERLLSRIPGNRPSYQELVECLDAIDSAPAKSVTVGPGVGRFVSRDFVGREQHIGLLEGALTNVRHGKPIVASVSGLSGMGKSSLVEHFLQRHKGDKDTIILRAKCHEREFVADKTLDALVDSIAGFIQSLPPESQVELLPLDIDALAFAFPVLGNFASQGDCLLGEESDPVEVRRRAHIALRDLLEKLGRKYLLVIFLDDLQWGDESGAKVIGSWLRSETPPRMLLIAAFRADQETSSSAVQVLRLDEIPSDRDDSLVGGKVVRFRSVPVKLGPLTEREVAELANDLVADTGMPVTDCQSIVDRAVQECGGHPLLVHELARGSATLIGEGTNAQFDLDTALWRRIQDLPETALGLVKAVSLSGRPINLAVAFEALSEPFDGRLMGELSADCLLRSCGGGWRGEVTTYHDRLRECVVAKLAVAESQGLHFALGQALAERKSGDHEQIAQHFEAANENNLAREYYITAGAQAVKVLAFERAAELYARAIRLTAAEDTEAHSWLLKKHGVALSQSGRGSEAAESFLGAASRALPKDVMDLKISAARQLCISGQTDQGRRLFREILAHHGIQLRQHPVLLTASFVSQRLRLMLAGEKFQTVDEASVSDEELHEIDLLWDAASGLSFQEPIAVASLHAKGMLRSIRAGEPRRLARALVLEAILHSAKGTMTESRVSALLQSAKDVSAQIDDPTLRALHLMGRGGAYFLQGEMTKAIEPLSEAVDEFAFQTPKAWWELTTSRSLLTWAHMHRGDYQSLRECVAKFMEDAEARGDRFLLSSVSGAGRPQVLLADGKPEEANATIEELIERNPYEEFQQQHVSILFSQVQIFLYEKRGREAWALLDRNWTRLRRSMQLRNQFARVTMTDLRARSAISAFVHGGEPQYLSRAKRDLKRIKREQGTWIRAVEHRLAAAIEDAVGEKTEAVRQLESSSTIFGAIGFGLSQAICQLRISELIASGSGKEFGATAVEELRSQKIVDPERFSATHYF